MVRAATTKQAKNGLFSGRNAPNLTETYAFYA